MKVALLLITISLFSTLLLKKRRHRFPLLLGVLLISFTLTACTNNSSSHTDSHSYQVASQRVVKAKAESKRLAAAVAKQLAESSSLAKVSSSSVKAASASSESKAAASASKAESKSESEAAALASAKAASESSSKTESKAQADSKSHSKAVAARSEKSDATPTSAAGKINTNNSGDIIGNVNSKIYHVPGQAGYRMNGANAVHFQTEAAAQAAGYRRAKR